MEHAHTDTITHSADGTYELGRRVGERLEPGDVVALIGELATGKTVLTQGIAEGIGVPPAVAVASPTFTLINRYRGRYELNHADLYRIGEPRDLATLGYEEWLDPTDAVSVVEWADRAEGFLPPSYLRVTLEHGGGNDRYIRLETVGPNAGRWNDILPKLCNELDAVRTRGNTNLQGQNHLSTGR